MNILFYNGSLRMGGIEKILVEILKGLDKDSKKIDLVISDGLISENFFENEIPKEISLTYLIPEELIKKTIYYKENKDKLYYKIMYNFYMKKEEKYKKNSIKRFLINKKYDVFIDFDMGFSKNIEKIKSNKKIVWIHSNINSWYKNKNKIKKLGQRLKKYDLIVTICEEMKELTIELFPFLKDKIIRIYNPFDLKDIIKKSEDNTELNKYYKKLLKEDYFISIGRLDDYSKDYLTLLKGYKEYIKSGAKEKLFILGDGPEREKILCWIKELKLTEKVILIGKFKNPYIWLKNAKLFIHSSRFEGLPTVLIEALICKIPIISSDCLTGPKEILENGKYGELYNVGDWKSLGEKIKDLLKDKKRYENLIDISKDRANEFAKEKNLNKIEKILWGD